ncbi:MraY family glycosyltransferase [Desulfoscipio gibsoniae]|uniref:UDP-N-acetylmuramyl pentapeptide phosphotransferase/UDP-N-acetylglucosamine-1-phosphate transferase n=1 Tax=Desulfoscipio gibsoniae DSM 7213 TaxID=767817 RepID=R4KLQ0_9FIRM|nr:MraY family glycosyltransferase [Desulfoscipio gibsoniae]AGL03594.1 UDP-N-acetylmuramyl pentapeptide phosphotransferase/UDP-N-acetylglucosamine-1-phosphate transferase [Desulfoscipio gibsoniae DSM 7213]
MEKYILPLVLALALGYLITPGVRVLAIKAGALDHPNPRKVHSGVMPRMGGLAVYLAFVPAVLLIRYLLPNASLPVWGLLTGATIILLVGMLDDMRGLTPRVKLLGQIVAALAVIPFGIQIHYITNPLTGQLLFLGLLSIPLTVFWVVAVTNAINLIDGLDGLAGGVSCIAALTMAAVAWTQWHLFSLSGMPEMIMLALVLVAAVTGFLKHNFHPATIFLGDSGSLFLGFTLAVMSIMSLTKSATAVSVIIPLVILGVPLLDTFFAVIRRYNKHKPIFQPDREHLHHQLMAMGLSHRQTVLVIYAISAFLGLTAVVLNLVSNDHALAMLVVLAILLIYSADRVGVLGISHRMRRGITDKYRQRRSSKM